VNGSGTWYFPTTTLSFAGNTASNALMAFIVKDMVIGGTPNIAQDTTGTYTGLATRTIGLIQ
jgi:hypothetical protein